MTTADTPVQIYMLRLYTLKSGLNLELKGMRLTRKARTCYSIVKSEFGFKGNKQSVLEQLSQYIEEIEYQLGIDKSK